MIRRILLWLCRLWCSDVKGRHYYCEPFKGYFFTYRVCKICGHVDTEQHA